MTIPIVIDWLTRRQAAEYLQVTTRTIDNYIRAGLLRSAQLVPGGAVRISASSVEKMLEGNRLQRA